MSILHLGTDTEALAAALADDIDRRLRTGDCFAPIPIVVPHRYLAKWLKLWLARKLGVAVNLRWLRLESALWEGYHSVDPRSHAATPEMLDGDRYRLLVLSVLLQEDDAELGFLRQYLGVTAGELPRPGCRRAWHLADKLGSLIRDYEYHRQHELIQKWLKGRLGLRSAADADALERAQRAVFAHIVREPDGRRALLNQATGRNFKTLPQYVMEVRELALHRRPAASTWHVFGLTHISPLHVEALHWLGQFIDLRLYGVHAQAARLAKEPHPTAWRAFADSLRQGPPEEEAVGAAGDDLMRQLGRAEAESLGLQAGLLEDGTRIVLSQSPKIKGGRGRSPQTVLTRLQLHLQGATADDATRLKQDPSLQIVACPGLRRELETVHNSILQNLQRDPTLRLTDIALLTTDISLYRPIVQAVFERPPRPLPYNLVDFSAAGHSSFGQALLAMLDLALESFARTAVFKVLLNPCFLARLGVEAQQAEVWLRWTEALGVHQGWDAREKAEQGLAASPFYAWRLGLQRLRLGRYMPTTPLHPDDLAPRFGHLIPFADVDSLDRDQLDVFAQAVEGLLPALQHLRRFRGGGRAWAEQLRYLIQQFLEVPEDRPEEEPVRDQLLQTLETLAVWDDASPAGKPTALPLALVREFVQSNLEAIPGSRGDVLTAGVVVAALPSMRFVPFRIIYVVGLNEELFPGSNQLSTLDLRHHERKPGDIRPAELNRSAFLDALLTAREKLYLTYSNWDASKDRPQLPAVCVNQLQRRLEQLIIEPPWQNVTMPATGHDAAYLDAEQQPTHQDVLVQYRGTERLLALLEAEREGRCTFDRKQRAEIEARTQARMPDFTVTRTSAAAPPKTPTLSIRDLRAFLWCPAEASLKRHLRIEHDEEIEPEDFEPLVTPWSAGNRLTARVLRYVAEQAGQGRLQQALQQWPARFEALHEEERLRCQGPEAEFGAVDAAALRQEISDRLLGEAGVADFLRGRMGQTFCGPILLGESLTPVGARLHWPALTLTLSASAATTARIVGGAALAWHDDTALDILVLTSKGEFDNEHLQYALLEPVLLYLALLANEAAAAPLPDIAKRACHVHVACGDGVHTIAYPAHSITPAEARQYLTQLATDCLDRGCFDLLPFPLLVNKKNDQLRAAFEGREDARLAAEYRVLVEETVAADAEEYRPVWKAMPLLMTLPLAVPEDAYAKVRRRLHLLDRGPALVRARAKPPPKSKAKAKKTTAHDK
jgi:exonuclease V gamma subunit